VEQPNGLLRCEKLLRCEWVAAVKELEAMDPMAKKPIK